MKLTDLYFTLLFILYNHSSQFLNLNLFVLNGLNVAWYFRVLLANFWLAKVMKLSQMPLGLIKFLNFLIKVCLFLIFEPVHSFFNSLIRSNCTNESFNAFLSRAFEVVQDFLSNLDFCLTKIQLVFQISTVFNKLGSVFS